MSGRTTRPAAHIRQEFATARPLETASDTQAVQLAPVAAHFARENQAAVVTNYNLVTVFKQQQEALAIKR